ncbi:asparagine synthase (glutamine-hydrolyzing) [Pricia sp. S334]|uniref:asparagine synthase (glutamine-hydrolyzing) n=1 Tax=Pricia mediterranea TaxID=3076079 RepID=A0ABU3L8Z0_9FLAO|nr:asparagine synthase (glutamine-hydrolyzing) [Pricia sp. S334]MDT7830216.1 asparagine synthase (glutamine-hydrolyzing) [Pricia sp. S334]
MCGIYGTTKTYTEEQVKKKLERTSFRGPDRMGWKKYSSDKTTVIFGHNRLSILDLDSRSDQPFTYQEKIHLVFNGEIYNYRSLRKILKQKGYSFRTTSDTEVICAAYLEYGENCVNQFNGMFAFVIYDEEKQIFYGARDRLGQKPFYYQLNGDKFEFASQLSSIQLFNKDLTISSRGIQEYLSWNYLPSPNSIFNEVKTLKEGYCFVYNLRTHSFKTRQYWDIDYQGQQPFNGSIADAQIELEQVLGDAVKMRLHADVPVGVFLSGGIDSSLIAALAAEHKNNIATFSVKFHEKAYDESKYANMVAKHLNTNHHEILCDYREGIDLVENFSYYYDEPFADPSAIPTMLLAKYTKNHVTVALSGDGGDENFLGYHRYEWIARNRKYMAIPKSIRVLVSNLLKKIPNNNRARVLANLIEKNDIDEAYLRTVANWDAPWLIEPMKPDNFEDLKYLMHSKKNIYERATDFDIKTYLSGVINTKVDRATMAYSLEARAPLLDYRVVELARALPTEYKYTKNNQKRILKEVLYKHVPKQIFDRPKSGFGIPFRIWFREELKEYVLDQLSEEKLNNIPGIQPNIISKCIQEHMDGKWDHYMLIWRLLVLSQWLSTNGRGIAIK